MESKVLSPEVVKRTSFLLTSFTNLIITVHLASNLYTPSEFVFVSLRVRMFRCKQHSVYPSHHIIRTVSTTVYGIYVFWLQGIYARQFK